MLSNDTKKENPSRILVLQDVSAGRQAIERQALHLSNSQETNFFFLFSLEHKIHLAASKDDPFVEGLWRLNYYLNLSKPEANNSHPALNRRVCLC